MSDVTPIEQSVVKVPEAVTLKPTETKTADKPLGSQEDAIVQKIQLGERDSNPDSTLKDIARSPIREATFREIHFGRIYDHLEPHDVINIAAFGKIGIEIDEENLGLERISLDNLQKGWERDREAWSKSLAEQGIDLDPFSVYKYYQIQRKVFQTLGEPTTNVEERNRRFDESGNVINLSETKGYAMCSEYAILSTYIAQKIGEPAHLIIGAEVESTDATKWREAHAFVWDDNLNAVFDSVLAQSDKEYPAIMIPANNATRAALEGGMDVEANRLGSTFTRYYGLEAGGFGVDLGKSIAPATEAPIDTSKIELATTPQIPDKPKLGTPMIEAYLRATDGLASQVLSGQIQPDKLQSYIFSIREQGVPGDKVEEVLLVRGISATRNEEARVNTDPNSDVEMLRRAMATEPLKVTDIRENPIPQEQILNRSRTVKINQGSKTVVQLDGQEWFSVDGKMEIKSVNGLQRNFIFMNSGGGHAEYNAFLDAYQIGQKGLDLIKTDPELAASMFLHEAGHDQYMTLRKDQQRALNDIFLQTPLLRDALYRFGTALYGDGAGTPVPNGKTVAGENYLNVHSVKKGKVDANIASSNNEKGIKDTRSLVFDFNGQPREVYASALITEYISYMAQLEMNRGVFDRLGEATKASRGGTDPRVDVMFLAAKRMRLDPQIQQGFESFGIFKDNTPQLTSDFTKIANTAN